MSGKGCNKRLLMCCKIKGGVYLTSDDTNQPVWSERIKKGTKLGFGKESKSIMPWNNQGGGNNGGGPWAVAAAAAVGSRWWRWPATTGH